MALPKLDIPIYTMNLLSENREIRYRPFLVKEEKILFMAMEGEDPNEISLAMKQVVNNCVQDEIDIDDMPLFDIEYILLNIRSKSVSDKSSVLYPCGNCEHQIPITIDLTAVEISNPPRETIDIMLTDTIGITLNYPKMDMTKAVQETDSEIEGIWKIIESCTERVFDETEVYDMKSASEEDRRDFFDSLTQSQFRQIQDFFEALPKLQYINTYTCPECGHNGDLHIEGMANFFG